MTRSELVKLMALVSTYWPHWSVPTNTDELSAVVNAWERLLGDVPAKEAAAAVDAIAVEGERFAPGPGVIRRRALDIAGGPDAPTEDEAWLEVREGIRRVGSLTRYGEPLPVWSHPAIGAVVRALGWDELCESENEVADRAHFTRLYRERVVVERNRQAAPPSVLAAIEAVAESKRLALGEAS